MPSARLLRTNTIASSRLDRHTLFLVVRRPLLTLALLSVFGCAGQGTTRTGFLSSYDGMGPTDDHTRDLIFVDPRFVPADYTVVVVDPIVWSPTDGAPPRDAATVVQLKADFRQSLVDGLSKNFKVVTADGGSTIDPGVLRVRAAITNTRRARWYVNAPFLALGLPLGIVGLPPPPPPNPGGASEEIEVTDARTGRRLVAIATYANGMPWNLLGYFEEYGHARRAFSLATELLCEQLQASLPPRLDSGPAGP